MKIFVRLIGIQIYVFGLLPPGEEPVSANYSIDGGPSTRNSLSGSPYEVSFLGNFSLFVSPQLQNGTHNISIVVDETGQNGRNYALDYFEVVRPRVGTLHQFPSSARTQTARRSETNVTAIVGGVLGALLFLTITLGLFLWARRRKARFDDRNRFPRIPCFGRRKSSSDERMSFSCGPI